MHKIMFALVLCSSLVLSSCPNLTTCGTATADLFVRYTVRTNGVRALVFAEFVSDRGAGTNAVLCPGDDVSVNGTVLINPDPGFPQYTAVVIASREYRFDLHRAGEGTYTSTVSAPEHVVITSPAFNSTVSRSTGFTVAWDDPDPESRMRYRASLNAESEDCPFLVFTGLEMSDPAVHYSSADFTQSVFDDDGNATGERVPYCEGSTLSASSRVASMRSGTLDLALDGTIEAAAVSEVRYTILP